jgi:hypothetical protein
MHGHLVNSESPKRNNHDGRWPFCLGMNKILDTVREYKTTWSMIVQHSNKKCIKMGKMKQSSSKLFCTIMVRGENPSCHCEFRFLLVPRKLKWSEYRGKTFTTSFKIALTCHAMCYHWVLTYRGASRAGWLPLRRVTAWNWMFELLLLTDSWLLREAGWILWDRT